MFQFDLITCVYEAQDWLSAHGNENWEFDENGLMKKRFASINDEPINEEDRRVA